MTDITQDSFAPGGCFSRAMLVTVLYRMSGSSEVNDKLVFNDVKQDMWYSGAVSWASATGFIQGTAEKTLSPMHIAINYTEP